MILAWFLKILTLLAIAAFAGLVCFQKRTAVRAWFLKRLTKESEEYKRLSLLLLKQPTEKEIRAVYLRFIGGVGFVWLFFVPGFWIRLVTLWPLLEVCWRIPTLWLRLSHIMRISRFQKQLVDVLSLTANALKSGLSLLQALGMVGEELPDPAGIEFRNLLSQLSVGQSLEAGLVEMQKRIPSDDLQLVVQAILTLRETGGNLAETFTTITDMMRERHKIHGKIRSLTAQGLVQAIIISAMPLGLLLMFKVINPEYFAVMTGNPLGWIALGLVFILQTVGGWMMKKIITIKV